MATSAPGRLSDDELVSLLELAKKADSVELKLTVPAADHRTAISGLGLDPLEAQIRQVFFFDTPDLDLNAVGVVARARRIQGRSGDTVVKLRPVDPDGLPAELRLSPNVVVEVDAMPGGYVCSATLKAKASAPSVREAALGELPIRKLFSKEQRMFFTAHAPGELALNELSVLGPIFVLKQNFEPKELGRRMVAELWFYPDGSRILELSTKCTATNAFQVAAEARAFLSDKGVSLNGRQETKTKAALTFFSKQLRAAAAAT
ncbi:MAG: adenylate cyclase [Gaiellaceae bacterium]